MWGKGSPRQGPALFSPPWYTPHHHPSEPHPSLEPWQQRTVPSPSAQPAGPEESARHSSSVTTRRLSNTQLDTHTHTHTRNVGYYPDFYKKYLQESVLNTCSTNDSNWMHFLFKLQQLLLQNNCSVGGAFRFNTWNLKMFLFLSIYSMCEIVGTTLPKLPLPSTLWNTKWLLVRCTRWGGVTGAGPVSPLTFPSK